MEAGLVEIVFSLLNMSV